MPIINPTILPQGPEPIKAKTTDTTLTEEQKVILNYEQGSAITPYTGFVSSSTQNSPNFLIGNTIVGYSNGCYLIDNSAKTVTAHDYYFDGAYNNGSSLLIRTSNTAVFNIEYSVVVAASDSYHVGGVSKTTQNLVKCSKNSRYVGYMSNDYPYLAQVSETYSSWTKSGTQISISMTYRSVIKEEGLIVSSLNKRYYFDEGGILSSEDITTSGSWPSWSAGSAEFLDNLYITGLLTGGGYGFTTFSRCSFYKIVKTGENSYSSSQVYLPSSVTDVITSDTIIASIGNLSNNKFYISTSVRSSETSDAKMYILSLTEEGDLSSAVIEKTYTMSDFVPSSGWGSYHKIMIPSFDLSKILFTAEYGARNFYPYMFALEPTEPHWSAVPVSSTSSFNADSYTGVTKTPATLDAETGDYTVDVATVLPPESS